MTLLLVLAAFAQVSLTIWSIVRLGLARIACIKRRELTLAQIALDDTVWPEPILKLQANVRNQFETPVLFYAGVATALGLGAVNPVVVALAWIFIASRIAHRAIHVGFNDVRSRFQAYGVGLVAIAGLWCALVVDTLIW